MEGVLEDQGRTRLLHLPDSESSTVDVWNQGRYGYLDLSRKVHRLSDIETFFLVWALGVLKVRRSLEDTAVCGGPVDNERIFSTVLTYFSPFPLFD